ncbi:hypothetical protein ACVR0S_08665 [Streptococcus dentapri]|uniref:MFS transporter n=1 Tax=Streptococcus dentapri TaxID=573564 RepID=A0ABV8D0R4_9STRE
MTIQEEWLKHFEASMGRKPTAAEYAQAKEAGFDFSHLTRSSDSPAEEGTRVSESSDSTVFASESSQEAKASVVSENQSPIEGQSVNPLPEASDFNQAYQEQLQSQEQFVAAQQQAQGFTQPEAFQQPTTQVPNKSQSLIVKELILPIVSLVLSVFFAGLSFTPAALVFFGLAFLGLIFAVVILILNIKGKKLMSFISMGVAVLALLISVVGVVANVSRYYNTDDNFSVSSKKEDRDVEDDSNDVNDYIDKNYKFEWKEDDFEDLKAGKDKVSDIIKKHGKASEAEIKDDQLILRYNDDSNEDSEQRVVVYFEKQYDGTFVLDSVRGTFEADDIDTSSSYKSDWTKSDYDALKEGDYGTGDGGTKWSEIKDKHSDPSEAYYILSLSSYSDDIEYDLEVRYSDYDADESHLDSVYLTFLSDDNGKTYYLISKYGSGMESD